MAMTIECGLLASYLDDGGWHTEAENVRNGIDLESYGNELRLIDWLRRHHLTRPAQAVDVGAAAKRLGAHLFHEHALLLPYPALCKALDISLAESPKDAFVKELLRVNDQRTRALSVQKAGPVGDDIEEGCTPADAVVLRKANHALAGEIDMLREALQFYAEGNHFLLADKAAWDTVTGEPQNYQCDEAGTATVEDGTVARQALALPASPTPGKEGEP